MANASGSNKQATDRYSMVVKGITTAILSKTTESLLRVPNLARCRFPQNSRTTCRPLHSMNCNMDAYIHNIHDICIM